MLIEAVRRHLLATKPRDASFALIGGDGLDGWALTIAARAVGLHTIVLSSPGQIEQLRLGRRAVVVLMGDKPNRAFAEAAATTGAALLSIPSSAFAAPPLLEKTTLPSDAECGGHILLTSGTTGVYKKVLIDCAAEAARATALGKLFGCDAQTVLFMGPMGLWTSAGHNRPVTTWYGGGCVVIDASPNLAQPLTRDGVNHLQITVPFLATTLEQLPAGFARNDGIRIGLVGSSPTWTLVERARARLSRNINIELGSTEGGTIAMTRIESPDDLRSHKLIPAREVWIVDETGRRLGEGEQGLVKIRLREGDARSYFDAPETTARFFDGDWFLPGDLGRIWDGRLELLGRITDVISIDGDKLSTLRFEKALEAKFLVSAAVLSAPNARGEDEIYVALETTNEALAAETGALAAMFPKFATVHLSLHSALPRNHMGKIDRIRLRSLLHLNQS